MTSEEETAVILRSVSNFMAEDFAELRELLTHPVTLDNARRYLAAKLLGRADG